jgi:HEAT repeat protein
MRRAAPLLALLLAAAPALAAPPADPAEAAAVLADGSRPRAQRIEAGESIRTGLDAETRGRALPRLLLALVDAEPDVRSVAAGALLRLGDARAVPRLVARLPEEPDEAVLAGLLLAVGRLGSPEHAPAVADLRSRSSPRLRAAVATALGDLGGPVARPRLLALLASPGEDADWAVRSAVLLALARRGTREDAGTVLVAYRDGGGAAHWLARAALAKAVAALDPDPLPVLDRLVADPDARVATAAAAGYARAGKPEALGERLSDPRPRARAASAAVAAEEGRQDLAPRILALATSDADASVRWSAALALSRLDHPASDEMLVAGLSSQDPETWASALAECRRKTGLALGRDPEPWRAALSARRRGGR